MQRAKNRLELVVPATLTIIFLLLYLNFGRIGETLIVMGSLPFALVGGVLIMALLGYNWSVATGVGFIALAGVAAETAVIMLLYLNHAWDDRIREGKRNLAALHDAVMEGAVHRVRPKVMTVTAIIGGLLPILWGHGTGASVMKRIAAPMVGGMLSATVLTLVVVPVIYFIWQGAIVARAEAGATERLGSPELNLAPGAGD
jgi:Cu(I)/Ag(I) efflux system membrane protein CusA/SilA